MSEGRMRRLAPMMALTFTGALLCMAPEAKALHPVRSGAEQSGKTPAEGQAAATSGVAEVLLVHAVNAADGGTGIDPRIGNVPALNRPPFASSYNSYEYISREKYPVKKLDTVT